MAPPTESSLLATALIATACVLCTRPASADATPADQALAQSLFDDARKLMEQKNYAEACPKFAESQRLDPGGGTILNLALCHEAEGKTASAWMEFNEALSRAIRDGRPEREARARERIAVLEPKLSRLTVNVAGGAGADLELTVDGAPWGAAMRGAAVPLDPGAHVIVAKAAGARPWTTTVTLGANADAKTVVVPLLAASAEPPTPMPLAPRAADLSSSDETPPRAGGEGRRIAGWIVAGVGVAGLGVGSAFGVMALSKRSDSDKDCNPSCTQPGVDLNNQAITAAWVSDFGLGLGVVGVVTGAYLVLTSHGSTPSAATTSVVRVLPAVLARGGGAELSVDWK